MTGRSLIAGVLILVSTLLLAEPSVHTQARTSVVGDGLNITLHPPVSRRADRLWLVPLQVGGRQVDDIDDRDVTGRRAVALQAGVRALEEGRYEEALQQLAPVVGSDHPLADYAAYGAAAAAWKLNRLDEARRRLTALWSGRPPPAATAPATPAATAPATGPGVAPSSPLSGALAAKVGLALAELMDTQGDHRAAADLYAAVLTRGVPLAGEDVWMRLAAALEATGTAFGTSATNPEWSREAWTQAVGAYARVYYQFPLSPRATEARDGLARLGGLQSLAPGNPRYRADLDRGEALYEAGRWLEAQEMFEALRPHAEGPDDLHLALRLAECDFRRGRHQVAGSALRAVIEAAEADTEADTESEAAEAFFYFAAAMRELGQNDDYATAVDLLVQRFPTSRWAANALNDLATHDIRRDEDEAAKTVLRQLVARFPQSEHAARAAWRVGWWAYRDGRYPDTVTYFDAAIRQFPRSDYRPAFLYWSGRAHEMLGDRATAVERYRLTDADYRNLYHGRLALERLTALGAQPSGGTLRFVDTPVRARLATVDPPDAPGGPGESRIRLLLLLGLHRWAIDELQLAARAFSTNAPTTAVIEATIAWARSQLGEHRVASAALRRIYPQYMAAGGEQLPADLLRVMFPLEHWEMIQAEADRNGIDPFLVAALVAQESAFDTDVRSPAGAVGLMQLLPATGELYARHLDLAAYDESMLSDPATNIRLGTAYLAGLLERFGAPYLALAAYNAGGSRVSEWLEERAADGLDPDAFIEDIPFPETQGYVRRVLGLQETYRAFYGPGGRAAR